MSHLPIIVVPFLNELAIKQASHRRKMDGTWRAKICDIIYMTRQQSIDVFGIKESQGENDKGGHETEAMRMHYRLIKPPKRARSSITDLLSRQKSETGEKG